MRLVCYVISIAGLMASLAGAETSLSFRVTDDAGRPLPCRVHLHDEAGQAVEALGLTRRLDHLVIDGEQTVSPPPGTYTYGIERSPEWEQAEGQVTLADGETKEIAVTLGRVADLTQRGWYSGDLHIHRDTAQIEQLMRSSDLHIGPVITWWNNKNLWSDRTLPEEPLVQFDGNRFYELMAGEDEREGGALLYFGLKEPLEIAGSAREYPSPITFVEQARAQDADVHLDIEKPFWWDVPVWLAVAQPDTIGLANNHMCRSWAYEGEAWGRPRDEKRLPSPRGNGYWSQEIYYHILNTGLRVPPSAGSASGVLPNPVAYNRVYVHVDGELTWDKWWDGLRAGRSFVTNGPILICRANGELPGHVFQSSNGQPVTISIDAELIATDNVPQLEIIKNGEVVQTVPCEETQDQQLSAEIQFDESGWFLVRAVTDNPRTFRFASSAPFYVEVGDKPRRISRESAQFFLDWVNERVGRVPNKLENADQQQEVLRHHEAARAFWQAKVDQATGP